MSERNKKMTVIEFCDLFTKCATDAARTKEIEKHVIRKYCPSVEKYACLQAMLNKSIGTTKSGAEYINMLINKLNFTMAIVSLYTDLDCDVDKENKTRVFEIYDALRTSGVLDCIGKHIGETELNELITFNSTLMDTFNSTQSAKAVAYGIFDMVIDSLQNLNSSLPEILKTLGESDNEKMKMIKEK